MAAWKWNQTHLKNANVKPIALQEYDASSAGGRAVPPLPQHRPPRLKTWKYSPGWSGTPQTVRLRFLSAATAWRETERYCSVKWNRWLKINVNDLFRYLKIIWFGPSFVLFRALWDTWLFGSWNTEMFDGWNARRLWQRGRSVSLSLSITLIIIH